MSKVKSVHPKVKAAALVGSLVVIAQVIVQALASAHLPGIAGEILPLVGAVLAAYAKAGPTVSSQP
jgi:hypothetical protein